MELQKIIDAVDLRIRETLSPKRYLHSRNTAVLSAAICLKNGIDEERGFLAGLAHDMAKPFGKDEQVNFLEKRNYGGLASMRAHPEILHGPVAKYLLMEEYSLEDSDILEGVEMHTAGGFNLSPLAKIIYAADKIEPSRKHIGGEFRNSCDGMPVDTLFFMVLEETVAWFRSSGKTVYPETVFLYNSLKGGAS